MICNECAREHALDEIELAFKRPDEVAALAGEERAARVRENDDLCMLDGARFFVRGLLALPVAGRAEAYCIGAWVEVAPAAFRRVHELWDEPDQAAEPAFGARLANAIPGLPQTRGLEAGLSLTGPTTRPRIVLDDAEHPLVRQQRGGITAHRAHEYSALCAPRPQPGRPPAGWPSQA